MRTHVRTKQPARAGRQGTRLRAVLGRQSTGRPRRASSRIRGSARRDATSAGLRVDRDRFLDNARRKPRRLWLTKTAYRIAGTRRVEIRTRGRNLTFSLRGDTVGFVCRRGSFVPRPYGTERPAGGRASLASWQRASLSRARASGAVRWPTGRADRGFGVVGVHHPRHRAATGQWHAPGVAQT